MRKTINISKKELDSFMVMMRIGYLNDLGYSLEEISNDTGLSVWFIDYILRKNLTRSRAM